MAQVAAALAGVDPLDSEAVSAFYAHTFEKYSPNAQELISGFLIGLTDTPTELELARLIEMVRGYGSRSGTDDRAPVKAEKGPQAYPKRLDLGWLVRNRRGIAALPYLNLKRADRRMIALLAQGLGDEAISRELGLTQAAASVAMKRVMKFLGAADRPQAVEEARRRTADASKKEGRTGVLSQAG